MRTRGRYATIGLVLLTVVACGEGPAEPEDAGFEGVDFGIAEGAAGAHHAEGEPAAAGSILDHDFAIALADSVGGIVLASYDADTRDLFILQVGSTRPGNSTCDTVTSGSPCHGRYFENVRDEDGGVRVDGRLDLTSGGLALDAVGPERLTGSFTGRLERVAGTGEDAIEIEDGRIDVDYRAEPMSTGRLTCLIQLTVDGSSCDA